MIKGLLFDLNGTVIDILTDEGNWDLYRTTANFLDYSGVKISPEELRDTYFELNRQQRHQSTEKFPEFDAAAIFSTIIERFQTVKVKAPAALAKNAAIVFRAASRYKLQLYPGVYETLAKLRPHYRMAALSDGQSLWAMPELLSVGLGTFFDSVSISGDYKFRKPEPKFFELALKKMKLKSDEVIFIGNDMYRDIYGAKAAGMKTVFFKSNQGDHNYHGAEADYIIYQFPELLNAIEFLAPQANA